MTLPLKSQLLKSFKIKGEQWDCDAIKDLMAKNNLSSDYWKYNMRFWLMELQSCGLVESIDESIDDGSFFEAGKLRTKYRLTEGGLQRIEMMLE